MFLFGKDICIQTSLDRWEASLATNTLTDYDERVSHEALRIVSEKGGKVAQTPAASKSASTLPPFFAGVPGETNQHPQSARNLKPSSSSSQSNTVAEMEETKQAVLEAQQNVDERTLKLKETKEKMDRYANKSRQIANTAELLKQKYAQDAIKKKASKFFC